MTIEEIESYRQEVLECGYDFKTSNKAQKLIGICRRLQKLNSIWLK